MGAREVPLIYFLPFPGNILNKLNSWSVGSAPTALRLCPAQPRGGSAAEPGPPPAPRDEAQPPLPSPFPFPGCWEEILQGMQTVAWHRSSSARAGASCSPGICLWGLVAGWHREASPWLSPLEGRERLLRSTSESPSQDTKYGGFRRTPPKVLSYLNSAGVGFNLRGALRRLFTETAPASGPATPSKPNVGPAQMPQGFVSHFLAAGCSTPPRGWPCFSPAPGLFGTRTDDRGWGTCPT